MDRMNKIYRIKKKRLASKSLFARWVIDDLPRHLAVAGSAFAGYRAAPAGSCFL